MVHIMLAMICSSYSRHLFALKYNIFVPKLSHGYAGVALMVTNPSRRIGSRSPSLTFLASSTTPRISNQNKDGGSNVNVN